MNKFPQLDPKQSIAAGEEAILKLWQERRIFERTIESRSKYNEFRFFDGPPFATGLPHYGHILAGTIKDAIPRYKTMKGFRVNRKWGWDCHGVPVEFQVEKEHKIGGKPGIEKMGVGKFNELCRSVVLRCADDWEKTVHRMGRFVDFQDDYKTMDPEFMESVWWVFGELWKKGLIYEGEKVVAYSPKLGSPLSNFEANLNYKDVDDPAVTVKFKLENSSPGLNSEETYLLAWTTTPWTLPSNLALAVHPDLEYLKIEVLPGTRSIGDPVTGKGMTPKPRSFEANGGDILIATRQFFEKIPEFEPALAQKRYKVVKGRDLVRKKYKPLFPKLPWVEEQKKEGAFRILSADYVSAEDGTGIVHQAPNFGEDDARVCFENEIKPLSPQPITDDGYFDEQIPELTGKYFRADPEVEGSKENNANDWVMAKLKEAGLLFKREQLRHSYPHCWRTDCALMYRGINTWFVDVQKIKQTMIEQNQNINWLPEHLKNGRFGKMLESAPDWAISRNRYWGTPIPVWRCDSCGAIKVPTSREELGKKTGEKVEDLHKHFVDDLTWKCEKCVGKETEITVIRHGETNNNAAMKFQGSQNIPLNENGRKQAEDAKAKFGDFDVVISAPLDRARETAQILFPNQDIEIDNRIREKNHGDLEGMTPEEIMNKYPEFKSRDDIRYGDAPNGDSFEQDLRPRIRDFLSDIQEKYAGKRVAIVTHRATITALYEELGEGSLRGKKVKNLFSFSFVLEPKMRRIPEVLDCWFESGAMPYASQHYPFKQITSCKLQTSKSVDSGLKIEDFPSADFIAEGLDQTRGWFYTLHVLGCALFGKNIFKNVITNGIVLAEDGQKMSKSKKNYPDPNLIFDKYGADAMRYYLLSSPVVRGENFRFAEAGVAEVLKSVILPLRSTYQFFSTYANIDSWKSTEFIFIRHGEGEHNVKCIYSGQVDNPHHLTEKGKKQVQEVCKNIGEFDVLVTSPFLRTKETAEILKRECGFEGKIIEDDRVRELHFGVLEGKGLLSRRERMAEPSTEQPEAVQERLRDFLSDMGKQHKGKKILVCSHGGVLMALDALEARWTTHEEVLRLPVPQTGKIRSIFPEPLSHNELDQWILSALQDLLQEYGDEMEAYDLEGALRPIPVFIDQLNNWYLRRNRHRFWASGLDEDKTQGYETLHHVLQTMAKVLAPICPFFAEELFQNINGGESVHLELFPQPRKEWQDKKLVQKMEQIRDIVGLSAGIRARAKIKLRQPLARLQVSVAHPENLDLDVIAAEANVKTVELLSEKELSAIATKIVKVNARMVGKKFGSKVQELIQKGKAGEFTEIGDGEIEIAGERLSSGEYEMGYLTAEGIEAEASNNAVVLLDTEITSELEIEGISREIVRAIQDLRKTSGFKISDHISILWNSEEEKVVKAFTQFGEKIAKEVLADSIKQNASVSGELMVDDMSVSLQIERV